jgi:hypothetical protein
MIRMLAPGAAPYDPVSPAATSATTGSVTGFSADGGGRLDARVPVHGRVVERRQRASGGHVLGQH